MANQFDPKSLENQFVNPPQTREIGFPWRIFLFASFLFGFAIFVFLGLKFGYDPYLGLRSKSVDKSISQLAGQVSESEQASLTTFYSQLVNLEKVLKSHRFGSNIFSFLEKYTTQGVYYTDADFSFESLTLLLKGRSRVIGDVVGQLGAFDGALEVENVVLDNVGFEGSDVIFDAVIKFKSSYFEKLE